MRRSILYASLLLAPMVPRVALPVDDAAGDGPTGWDGLDGLDGLGGLAQLHDDPFLARAIVASEVADLATGAVLHAENADKLLTPASTVKLVTAMAVLEGLPADLQLETPVGGTGPVVDGVLDGDLVIVGAGDPSLGRDGDVIAAWADALVADGLRRVRGAVVADARLFTRLPLGPGWMWDDATAPFSAPVTALALDGNVASVGVRAEEGAVRIDAHPCLELDSEVEVADPDDDELEPLVAERLLGSERTVIRGELPPDGAATLSLTLPDPPSCAARLLASALEDRGVEVFGRPRRAGPDEPLEELEVLITHRSPPLDEMLRHMLVRSDNLYAESLIRLLDPASEGRDFEGARPAVARLMRSAGVPDDAWRLVDGSGLSRYDQLTAETLVRLLRYAHGRPWGETLRELMPASGEGTLRARLAGGPAVGRVQAKTGSMTGVFNLAGYVFPEDGAPVAFALLSNGVPGPGSVVRYSQDRALQLLAARAEPPAPPPAEPTGCGARRGRTAARAAGRR